MGRQGREGRGEGRLVKPRMEPDSRRIAPSSEVSRKTAKCKPGLVMKVRRYHHSRHLVCTGPLVLHLQQVLLLIHHQLGVRSSQLRVIGEEQTVLELLMRNVVTTLTQQSHITCMCCMRLQAELSWCLQTEQVSTMGSVLVVFVWASLASLASRPSSSSSSC